VRGQKGETCIGGSKINRNRIHWAIYGKPWGGKKQNADIASDEWGMTQGETFGQEGIGKN